MKVNKIKLSIIMAKQDLRQKDLADKTKMSRGNLSTIINGKNCQPKTVIRISEALGVNVTDILED